MTEGPYKACYTSKSDEPYLYGISGPGDPSLGYYAWYLYPENTFASMEEAEKVAKMMNLAFEQGRKDKASEIKKVLGD